MQQQKRETNLVEKKKKSAEERRENGALWIGRIVCRVEWSGWSER